MKRIIFLIVLLALFIQCQNQAFVSEDCSITLDQVIFSKSVNKAQEAITLRDNQRLQMTSGPQTDYFMAPNGQEKYANAPLLLTAVDNRAPFTFVTKATPGFTTTYDAGAVYLFAHDEQWLKFAFEMDEQKLTRLVTVRTNGTSDDNNHDVVSHPSVWLKISSDTESVGFYYSTDSTAWQLVRVYKNDFPPATWIGLSSQSPISTGTTTLFEGCLLSNVAIRDFRKGI